MTFNETEIIISINIRSLSEKTTTFITFIEITEIIENFPDISDIDIANANDANIILKNIENALFESITVEFPPVRRFTRHRKAIFKIIKINIMATNIMEIAETSIISVNEKKTRKKIIYRKL
jgi:hypothetical protein